MKLWQRVAATHKDLQDDADDFTETYEALVQAVNYKLGLDTIALQQLKALPQPSPPSFQYLLFIFQIFNSPLHHVDDEAALDSHAGDPNGRLYSSVDHISPAFPLPS